MYVLQESVVLCRFICSGRGAEGVRGCAGDDMAWEESADGRRMLELYHCRRRGFRRGCLGYAAVILCGSCWPCFWPA